MNGDHPLVERDMRVFKDRPDGHRERLATASAFPETFARLASAFGFQFGLAYVFGFDYSRFRRDLVGFAAQPAMRTDRAVRPALFLKVSPRRIYRAESFH